MTSPAARAWITLGAGILVWECFAPPDQLLSEEVDRWLITHPVLTTCAVMCVAFHLVNVFPVAVDPLSITFTALRRARVWPNKTFCNSPPFETEIALWAK